jgi:hypothetical protein
MQTRNVLMEIQLRPTKYGWLQLITQIFAELTLAELIFCARRLACIMCEEDVSCRQQDNISCTPFGDVWHQCADCHDAHNYCVVASHEYILHAASVMFGRCKQTFVGKQLQ